MVSERRWAKWVDVGKREAESEKCKTPKMTAFGIQRTGDGAVDGRWSSVGEEKFKLPRLTEEQTGLFVAGVVRGADIFNIWLTGVSQRFKDEN